MDQEKKSLSFILILLVSVMFMLIERIVTGKQIGRAHV